MMLVLDVVRVVVERYQTCCPVVILARPKNQGVDRPVIFGRGVKRWGWDGIKMWCDSMHNGGV